MSRHLKKYAAPKSWNVPRKDRTFIKKPHPGSHNKNMSQSIDLTLRQLSLAKTAREIKKILHTTEVLVDGKRIREPKFSLGIFAVLSFVQTKMHYRMMLDAKGRLVAKPIDSEQAQLKISKIINKTILPKGHLQINCNDGRNLLVQKDTYKVGDSLVMSIPNQTIKEHLPLTQGAEIMLIAGKRSGVKGILTGTIHEKISYKQDEQQTETLKEYAVVIGPSKTLKIP